MKKFVGLVNGKSFDSEEDFNKAAQEAIKANEDNLSITSYYTYSKDSDEKVVDEVDDDTENKFVPAYEYFLGERKPENVSPDSVEYDVPVGLEARLKEASNKGSIKENVNFHVEKLVNTIHNGEKKIKNLLKEIEDLQNELYKYEDEVKDLKGRRRYYNTILDILDSTDHTQDQDKESTKEVTDTTKDADTKDNIRKILGVDPNISLFDVLKHLCIL